MLITDKDVKMLNIQYAKILELTERMIIESIIDRVIHKSSYRLGKNNEGFFNILPAIIERKNVMGCKCVSKTPKSNYTIKGNILLYDMNGDLLSVLDGNEITEIRTASIAVACYKAVCKYQKHTKVGMIGLGGVGKKVLNYFLDVVKDNSNNYELLLENYHNHASDIVTDIEIPSNVNIKVVDKKEDLIGCDTIFSSVRYASDDFFKPDDFKKGTLLIPIHTRGFMECDRFFDKVFVDNFDSIHDFKYIDDIKKKGYLTTTLFDESVRIDKDDRILIYNIGNGYFDVMWANEIYNLMKENKDE